MFENSNMLGIDLLKVDTVILSHGHFDHGGTLEKFLKINRSAKVYAQRKAFEKHYSNANNALYTDKGKDDFSHEQNMIFAIILAIAPDRKHTITLRSD